MHAPPRRGVAAAKADPDDHAWRGRILVAFAVMAAIVLGVGAVGLDWSEGLDMALGQLAGMAAPLGLIGAVWWAAAASMGKKG